MERVAVCDFVWLDRGKAAKVAKIAKGPVASARQGSKVGSPLTVSG
jgi:hypothetical protein